MPSTLQFWSPAPTHSGVPAANPVWSAMDGADRSDLRTRQRGAAEDLGFQAQLRQQRLVPSGLMHVPHAVESGAAQVGVVIVGAEGPQHQILALDDSRRPGPQIGLVLAHPQQLGDDPRRAQRQPVAGVVFLGRDHPAQLVHLIGRAGVLPGKQGTDRTAVRGDGAGVERCAEKPIEAICRGSMPDESIARRHASIVRAISNRRILLDPARPRIRGAVVAVVSGHRVAARSKIMHRAPVVPTSTPAKYCACFT
jgi:hypothetical protein